MPRAFLVGNGPSLRAGDLDKLIGEVSFGVNRIHLIYDKTKWRPSYWVIGDVSRSMHWAQDIDFHMRQGYPCYVRADIPRGGEAVVWGRKYPDTFLPWIQCDHIDIERGPTNEWHKDGSICKYGGSMMAAIQIAAGMELNPLYLIGCDLGYRPNAYNNFDPKYADPDCLVVPWDRINNQTMRSAHGIAKRECEKRGIKILNASRGGKLGVYDKVDFDSLFPSG